MINPSLSLSNPLVSIALRTALGAYVIYMSRKFYADPLGYFRRSARVLVDVPWLAPMVRAMARFCLWGGCFIIATAVAVQIFNLHGELLATALVIIAAIAAWLLLPDQAGNSRLSRADRENEQRQP